MHKRSIRLGVIGCADVAKRHVLPAIKALPGLFTLQAVASRSRDKADQFANEFNASPEYSYNDLVGRDDIDAIYIPLPNSMHYEWVKKGLLANKHVLVEKSMACAFSEVQELNCLAKQKQLILLENFQFRFHVQLDKIKAALGGGDIGSIRVIKSSFGFPPFADKNNIRYSKSLGGGALFDAGAYPIKIAQELLAEDLYVDSASLCVDPDIGVDIWGAAQLKSRNSAVTVQTSFGFDNLYQCSVEIWGSKGILKSSRIFTSPPGAKASIERISADGTELISIEECNHFENILAYFAALIADPASASVEYSANIRQALLLKQLREKASE
jgi:hypothetical protein